MFVRWVNAFRLSERKYFSAMSDSSGLGAMESKMREKLTSLFQPTSLVINNDSWKHRHHDAMRAQNGGNGETHFSIRIVSDVFNGKSPIQRHRMINSALSEEFTQGLHALSLEVRTEEEATQTSNLK